MADIYYQFYPGDYHRDTGDLSMLEHGAYRVMLDHYYMQRRLPADPERLYRLCRAFTQAERAAVDTIAARYFIADESGHLINNKAEKEIAKRDVFVAMQTARGRAGADARWKAQAIPKAMRKQCLDDGQPSPSPSPYPSPPPKNKKAAADAPFNLPSKEEIQESSDPKIEEYIQQVCARLFEEKIFPEANAFKNKMLKNRKNGRGVLHVLTRCYLARPDDPWAYCQKIIAVEDLNYNERDYRKTAQ